MKISIRELQPDDFKLIWPMFKEVAEEGTTYPYSPEINFEEGKTHWFMPSAKVYGAFSGDKLVASRYIVPNKTGLGSHIANTGVIVDKNFRGQKICKQMLEFAISQAKKLGFKAIQLNLVVVTNEASVKNCLNFGFKIIGTLPGAFYYKKEKFVDAYVMFKELD